MQHPSVSTSHTDSPNPGGTAPRAGQLPSKPSFPEVRRRALAPVFSHASRVLVVADERSARDLTAAADSPFIAAVDEQSASGDAGAEVLVLSLDEPWLTRAIELAGRLGRRMLYVLLANTPPDDAAGRPSPGLGRARARLRERGFAVVDAQRVFWAPPADPSGTNLSRTARLDRETREVLVECRRRDDPETVAALEERVATLGRQLELLSDLQVQQARTREAESRRLGRLEELEATVERLERIRSVQSRALLVEESKEIGHLREEIAFMKSTRFWRLGERYWALRRWLTGRIG